MILRRSLINIVRSSELSDHAKIIKIEEQLAIGATLDEKTPDNNLSLLHEACFNGGSELIKRLLQKMPSLINANRIQEKMFFTM